MKRTLDANAAYAIAFLAFALSYSKLVDLALRAEYGLMAYAWPLIVDGLAVMAARGILRLTGAPQWYARGLLLAGTAISILAAILNATVRPGPLPDPAKAAVWIVPALCLPFAYELARKLQASHLNRATPHHTPDLATSHIDIAPVAVDEVQDVTPTTEPSEHDEPLRLMSQIGAEPPRRKSARRKADWTDEQKAEALRLVAAGVSQREAGRRIGGASGNSVRRWVMAQAV
ncbi:DUF2637 domain-containing protein [Rhodococcus sp. USK10]|uniref:DUF2637 domain-containing protein n=1 Tax=Rhodococcus sp. USK10 TaxID=2789739 RepID=UPI001C5E9EBC|nr:DUF2637 domain-containing protein [Rhodococcus sp. USK10]QYB01492.1 DUF2637 domain-containing protein [Rhodococcus sp. USK10]